MAIFETRRKVPVSLRKSEGVESFGSFILKLHKRRTIVQRRVKLIEYRILQFVLSWDSLAELLSMLEAAVSIKDAINYNYSWVIIP